MLLQIDIFAYVRTEPNIVDIPICRGMELDNPQALTPPMIKIWKSISVKPATNVAPKRAKLTLKGALMTYSRFLIIESSFGGIKDPPRIREKTNAQMNLQIIKLRWKIPGGEFVQSTALLRVAQPRAATKHMISAIVEFCGLNIVPQNSQNNCEEIEELHAFKVNIHSILFYST